MNRLFSILALGFCLSAHAASTNWTGAYVNETNGSVLPLALEGRLQGLTNATASAAAAAATAISTATNAQAIASNAYSTATNALAAVTNGTDTIARAGVTSNSASIVAVGAVATNAAAGVIAVGAMASNAVSGMGIRLWADATTNYHAILEDGATAFSSTSFSATFNWCVTNGKTAGLYAPIIELGPSVMADGSEVDYAIDAPIIVNGTNSGPQAITVRGYGNIGTSIKVATNYTGRMFVFTNMYSIIRFESIRFQDWLSANTNPVIESSAAEHVLVDCEFTGWKGSAIRQHGYHGGAGSSWNRIESCWFIGNTNDYPMIDLNSPAFDWTISDCHFSKWNATTTDVIRISGEVHGVKILGCRFLSTGAVGDNGYCTINVLGGKGLLASGNTFYGEGYKSQIFRFDPATSNDYRALVIGNNAANSYATNFVYIGTNAHNIKVVWNQLDGYIRSAVSVTTNSGKIIVYNGTADVLRVSALGLGTNAAVSNWPASGGGIDEAAAGQIATNVVAAATTNDMTNINWSALGGGGGGDLAATNTPTAGQMLYASTNGAAGKTNLYFADAPEGGGTDDGVFEPYQIPYSSEGVTLDPTNGWWQTMDIATGTSTLSFAACSTGTAFSVRLDIIGTNALTWNVADPVVAPTIATEADGTTKVLFDSPIGSDAWGAKRIW